MTYQPVSLRASRIAAFTVPELLAVVAVIMIIMSMLVPVLNSARETARDAICKTHQRQIGIAFLAFASSNKSRMPGIYLPPWSGTEESERSWMGNEVWSAVSYEGSTVQYLGGKESALEMYRCPSLKLGVWNSGVGSNGKFDYTGLLVFTGARRYNIPSSADWRDPANNVITSAATPLILEEDPRYYLNYGNIEPGHSNQDRTGTWHNGGGNYIALDGHSTRLKPAGAFGPACIDWQVKTPSGATTTLTSHGSGYGGWDKR